jgi:hypothetical protein
MGADELFYQLAHKTIKTDLKMNTNSLVQKLGFNVSDLIAPYGHILSIRNDSTEYCVSERLYEALRTEAKATHRLVSRVFSDLRAEVLESYKHENGPVASILGFKVSDLLGKGCYKMSFGKDSSFYSISPRLKDAIGAQAEQRQVLHSTVFFEFQEEVAGVTFRDAIN